MARPVLSWLIPLTLFASFLLFLLVSLSLPIIKTFYLVQVNSIPSLPEPQTNVATELRFGVWGFCATSILNEPTAFSNNGVCSAPRLGYDLDPALLAATGHPEIAQLVEQVLVVVLVLHPVLAGLTFFAFICAIPGGRVRACEIFTLVVTVLSAVVSTIALGVVFGLIGVMKSRVGPLTGGEFQVGFGNCPWMVLTATILLWIAVVLASLVACNCCGLGRRRLWEWNERLSEKK